MSLDELTKRPVYTVERSETVAAAARLMCDHSVGALVITDAGGTTPLGIITDRDIVWMVAEGMNPRSAGVSQFVQSPLVTAHVTDTVSDVAHTMREHGVRRLPILLDADGHLIGLVSLDDLLVRLGRELRDLAGTIVGELEQEWRIAAAVRASKLPREHSTPTARSAA